MTMDIKNKRIIITGGTSGIGLATAQALQAKGARVFITGRRPDTLAVALETLRRGGGWAEGVAADVATEAGRKTTLATGIQVLGGLDILVNNAGGVRAGRLEDISETEIRAMIEVDLVAPILLTQAALPALRASGGGLVVNVTSGIALIGMPFYATYAAVKAGLARFGEALRRELKGEGVHVLTVYPGATDTPMMQSSKAGPDLGFVKEPASAVADAIVDGVATDAFEVIRGGETRAKMIATNRENPGALDERFLGLKAALGEAVRDHSAL
jgi:short-subunit dehydrogenase